MVIIWMVLPSRVSTFYAVIAKQQFAIDDARVAASCCGVVTSNRRSTREDGGGELLGKIPERLRDQSQT